MRSIVLIFAFCLLIFDFYKRYDVLGMVEGKEQKHVIAEVAGKQEVVADVFPAVFAELFGVLGGVEKLFYREGSAFDGMAEQAGMFMRHLQRNATDGGGDDGLCLPEGLGDGQAKTFLEGFLDYDVGGPLEGVDFDIVVGHKQDVDVGVVCGFFLDFVEDLDAFGVVCGGAACEDESAIVVTLDKFVGVDDTDGVFEAVEAGNLGDDGFIFGDIVFLQDGVDGFLRQFLIFVTQGVNGRRDKELSDWQRSRKGRRGEDGGIVFVDEGA